MCYEIGFWNPASNDGTYNDEWIRISGEEVVGGASDQQKTQWKSVSNVFLITSKTEFFFLRLFQTQHETFDKTWKKWMIPNQSTQSFAWSDWFTQHIDESLLIFHVSTLKHKSAHHFIKFYDKYWFYSNLTHNLSSRYSKEIARKKEVFD